MHPRHGRCKLKDPVVAQPSSTALPRAPRPSPHEPLTEWSVPPPRVQVLIEPPYSPDTCKGKPSEKQLTDRVKKVLGGILKKLDADGDRLR